MNIKTKKDQISNNDLLDSINRSFSKIEDKMEILDQNIQATRREMVTIGEKFVPYHKFDELALRVSKLEKSKK